MQVPIPEAPAPLRRPRNDKVRAASIAAGLAI